MKLITFTFLLFFTTLSYASDTVLPYSQWYCRFTPGKEPTFYIIEFDKKNKKIIVTDANHANRTSEEFLSYQLHRLSDNRYLVMAASGFMAEYRASQDEEQDKLTMIAPFKWRGVYDISDCST